MYKPSAGCSCEFRGIYQFALYACHLQRFQPRRVLFLSATTHRAESAAHLASRGRFFPFEVYVDAYVMRFEQVPGRLGAVWCVYVLIVDARLSHRLAVDRRQRGP